MTKTNYLNNKDLLTEIHKSKLTYCSWINPEYQDKRYGDYDIVVDDLTAIDGECVEEARRFRATRLYKVKREQLVKMGFKSHEIKLKAIPEAIPVEDIVFRVMTGHHIPLEASKARNKKEEEDFTWLNFHPFIHYVMLDNQFDPEGNWVSGTPIEVVRSHWKNGEPTGEFSVGHGKVTNKLALMFKELVIKFSQSYNWRGYSYVDEMQGQALMQLSQVILKFDEGRSNQPNPFSYYTAIVNNSFKRIHGVEKKNQGLRDDILMMNGMSPSSTRQLDDDMRRSSGDLQEQWEQANRHFDRPGSPPKNRWKKKVQPTET